MEFLFKFLLWNITINEMKMSRFIIIQWFSFSVLVFFSLKFKQQNNKKCKNVILSGLLYNVISIDQSLSLP